MFQICRNIAVVLFVLALYRYFSPIAHQVQILRQDPHWQSIEADLRHAGGEALKWAEEDLRQRLRQPISTEGQSELRN